MEKVLVYWARVSYGWMSSLLFGLGVLVLSILWYGVFGDHIFFFRMLLDVSGLMVINWVSIGGKVLS